MDFIRRRAICATPWFCSSRIICVNPVAREGGDRSPRRFREIFNNAASKHESRDTAISPLAGEMPTGRGGRELRSCRSAAKCGIESGLMKNNVVQYQSLERIAQHIPSTPSHLPSYLPVLLSWDRMITGIRESRRPMAAGGAVPSGGRSSLSHVPPGLRAFRKDRPMRQPGQKAVTGRVASHTSNTG